MKSAVRERAGWQGWIGLVVRIGCVVLAFMIALMCISGCQMKSKKTKRKHVETKSAAKDGSDDIEEEEDDPEESVADEDQKIQVATGSIYLGPYGEYYSGIPAGTRSEEDSVKPPLEGRYLDGTRDLKSTYTFDEVFERFAIRLYGSTVIYTATPELHPTITYIYMNERLNEYQISARFTVTNPDGSSRYQEEIYFFWLWDSEYRSIDAFASAFRAGEIDSARRQNGVTFTDITIYEETDEHLFGSVLAVPDHDFGAEDYYIYYYAQTIGDRVFFTYFGNRAELKTPLSEEGRVDFLKYSQLLFSNLREDDGCEPYLQDKIVNMPIAGKYFVPNYNVMYDVSENRVGVSVRDGEDLYGIDMRLDVSEEAYEVREGEPQWEQRGEIRIRHYYGTEEVLIELDGRTCLFELYNGFDEKIDDVDTVQEFLDLLEEAGIFEK